jgi:hypothetical protein
VIGKSGTTTKEILLADIDAEFIYAENGWEPELILRSNDKSRFYSITGEALAVSSTSISMDVTYTQANSVLKLVDPGTWDLYASNGEETVYVASGNLSIDIIT